MKKKQMYFQRSCFIAPDIQGVWVMIVKKFHLVYIAWGFMLICCLSGCARSTDWIQKTLPYETARGSESPISVTEEDESTGSSDAAIASGNSFAARETENLEEAGILSSVDDIALRDVDGKGKEYVFLYNKEEFTAQYTEDHWKIIDSYKIGELSDMTIICQALLDEHPIHGKDMESYRTADDMAFEWLQHNLVYDYLSEDSDWRDHVKDVDLNPADQGKTFKELYEDRTGKEFRLKDFVK